MTLNLGTSWSYLHIITIKKSLDAFVWFLLRQLLTKAQLFQLLTIALLRQHKTDHAKH